MLGMVHAVLPPAELRDHVHAIAAQLARTPAELLALVKDNLNQAEDEIDRLRFLFANEADNQAKGVKSMMARLEKRAAT
jgi:enoyl-CoA hydratase/carnithine racemase